MENEIELDDTSFVLNQGLIRVDPDYRCVSIFNKSFLFYYYSNYCRWFVRAFQSL